MSSSTTPVPSVGPAHQPSPSRGKKRARDDDSQKSTGNGDGGDTDDQKESKTKAPPKKRAKKAPIKKKRNENTVPHPTENKRIRTDANGAPLKDANGDDIVLRGRGDYFSKTMRRHEYLLWSIGWFGNNPNPMTKAEVALEAIAATPPEAETGRTLDANNPADLKVARNLAHVHEKNDILRYVRDSGVDAGIPDPVVARRQARTEKQQYDPIGKLLPWGTWAPGDPFNNAQGAIEPSQAEIDAARARASVVGAPVTPAAAPTESVGRKRKRSDDTQDQSVGKVAKRTAHASPIPTGSNIDPIFDFVNGSSPSQLGPLTSDAGGLTVNPNDLQQQNSQYPTAGEIGNVQAPPSPFPADANLDSLFEVQRAPTPSLLRPFSGDQQGSNVDPYDGPYQQAYPEVQTAGDLLDELLNTQAGHAQPVQNGPIFYEGSWDQIATYEPESVDPGLYFNSSQDQSEFNHGYGNYDGAPLATPTMPAQNMPALNMNFVPATSQTVPAQLPLSGGNMDPLEQLQRPANEFQRWVNSASLEQLEVWLQEMRARTQQP